MKINPINISYNKTLSKQQNRFDSFSFKGAMSEEASIIPKKQLTEATDKNGKKFFTKKPRQKLLREIKESNIKKIDFEMLQNNLFTLTTVENTEQYDARQNAYVNKKIYTTNFAANCSKLICVTDTEAQEEATTKYEYEKAIINEKESRIDERMSILQTELQANNAQKEALKSIIQENTDRNFKIFA